MLADQAELFGAVASDSTCWRLEEMRTGFAEMRAKFDQTSAGMAQIVELLITRDDQ